MIRNAHRLAPQDGRRWREYASRVIQNPARDKALCLLDRGTADAIPRQLILEGPTHADCLIECEKAFVWIEGKRNDWLSPCTKWDVTRDQLARNLEAAWILATSARKDFWFVLCHERELKHHEAALVAGYRDGTWKAGWPHLPEEVRQVFREKIGIMTWASVFRRWPAIVRPFPYCEVLATRPALPLTPSQQARKSRSRIGSHQCLPAYDSEHALFPRVLRARLTHQV